MSDKLSVKVTYQDTTIEASGRTISEVENMFKFGIEKISDIKHARSTPS